jgi:hypothetical protein
MPNDVLARDHGIPLQHDAERGLSYLVRKGVLVDFSASPKPGASAILNAHRMIRSISRRNNNASRCIHPHPAHPPSKPAEATRSTLMGREHPTAEMLTKGEPVSVSVPGQRGPWGNGWRFRGSVTRIRVPLDAMARTCADALSVAGLPGHLNGRHAG